jgi:uncharacterized protein with GYD domain
MPVFVLMTKLSPEWMNDALDRKVVGREWMKKVTAACPDVKWLGHYAILGPYDYMDIYEAPDNGTAHLVSMISRSEGAVSAESWQAMPWDEHLRLMETMG